ncbi:MAG: ABC transporter ATP-binding protein [Chloroflexota bacterium]
MLDGVAIQCQGLTKRFGQTTALDKLDLAVPEGTVVGFLGPNGAGKTTTLRILAGLSRATSGTAWVAGHPVDLHSPPLQRTIGYLPDQPAFYGWMTGREYLTFVGGLFGLGGREVRRRCDELLGLVELSHVAQRRIGGYSRGMKQRLGIAQALINQPKVLLMDEPTSALDPVGRMEVLETLLRLKEQQTTVFLSTHILADAERICDQVAIIDKGRLLVQASVEELRRRYATPVFELEFEEQAGSLVAFLESVTWVQGVKVEQHPQGSLLRVHVSDPLQARRELPQIVVRSGLTLRRYEQVLPALEDVFVKLVGVEAGQK